MKKMAICAVYVAFLAAAVLADARLMHAKAADAVSLRFGTAGIGGAWYVYGAGIAELALAKLPKGSTIDVLPHAAAIGNVKLIQKGEAELGLSHVNVAAYACAGTQMFDAKQDNVRALIGGLDVFYFGTIVTVGSGAKSWDDIVKAKNGFRLLTAPVGGVGELGVRQVLGLLDSSHQDVAAKGGLIRAMGRAATASAIADGNADGWAHVVTKGHPVATELMTTTDMRILPLPEKVISGMVQRFGWVEAKIPANTFQGQIEDVATVKAPTNILVNANVPDDVVYAITKAIIENANKLSTIHAGLADFNLKNAVDPHYVGKCPWHPGAVKAFREAGLM